MAAAERKYIEADVNTASPLRLVLIVYDVALTSLSRAAALDPQASESEFIDTVSKAREALLTLLEGLDSSKAPELTTSLASLYVYLFRRLTDAITGDDTGAVSEVHKHLSELRQAWQQLMDDGHADLNCPGSPEHQGRIVSVTC